MKQIFLQIEDKDYEALVTEDRRLRGSIAMDKDGEICDFHRWAEPAAQKLPAMIYPLRHGKVKITEKTVTLRMKCKADKSVSKKAFVKEMEMATDVMIKGIGKIVISK